MLEFKPVTDEAIIHVAENMREADVKEIWASHHHEPEKALRYSTTLPGMACSVWFNNEPSAILGVVVGDIITSTGSPWLLGTDNIVKYRRLFLENSKMVLNDMFIVAKNLSNYVHVDNTVSIRWLKWLGFIFEPARPYGIEGELFHRFHLEKK